MSLRAYLKELSSESSYYGNLAGELLERIGRSRPSDEAVLEMIEDESERKEIRLRYLEDMRIGCNRFDWA